MGTKEAGIAVATLLACLFFNFSLPITLLLTAILSYLPSYLDGSEYTAEGRYWDWFAKHARWKSVYKGSMLKFSPGSSIDPDKQYIFCSHPHGPVSAHHVMYMGNGSTPGFHNVSPGSRRRDLVQVSSLRYLSTASSHCGWAWSMPVGKSVSDA